jgi:hypothetical protein
MITHTHTHTPGYFIEQQTPRIVAEHAPSVHDLWHHGQEVHEHRSHMCRLKIHLAVRWCLVEAVEGAAGEVRFARGEGGFV